jgi:hypothetical protein
MQGATLLSCAAQQQAESYPVRGIVENSVTHQPIARALVSAMDESVFTDNEGRFELHLHKGIAQITAKRPGYGGQGSFTGHMVDVGPDMPEFNFGLVPSATISGHVTVSGSEGGDGINFLAYRKTLQGGHAQWAQVSMATTNSEGIFKLLQLQAPGSYVLCSSISIDRGDTFVRHSITYGYPSLCFPGVTDLASATPLSLEAGQQIDLEIALPRQRFYPASITVLNRPQGQSIPVQIFDPGGRPMNFGTQWNNQTGTATAQLPNGSYYAIAQTFGKTSLYGRVDFKVADQPVPGLTLTLLPLLPLTVDIHRDFTTPDGGNRLSSGWPAGNADPVAPLGLSLFPADGTTQGAFGGNLRRPEGSSGSNLLEMDARPGRYWVQASPFEGYVSSITSGGADLTREPLLIGPGNAAAPIEITLRNDVGSIVCTVNRPPTTTGTPSHASGELNITMVYAFPASSDSRGIPEMPRVGTNTTGPVSIPNLAPGSYRVVALDFAPGLLTGDPDEIAKLRELGKAVTVEPGSATSVSVDLTLTGRSGAAQ